jgi:hypothetical protein
VTGRLSRLTLCIIALPALSGCGGVPMMVLGGLASAGSLYTTVDKLTEAASPFIGAACAEYQNGKAAADAVTAAGLVPLATTSKVTSIESFGDAACGSGSGPPAGDPLSTAIWLGKLAGQLTTLTTPAR